MSKVKVNLTGMKSLLRSAQAQAAVRAAAESLAAQAGEGFGVETRTTSRARAYVHPVTNAGIKRNYRERVLERLSTGG